MCVTPVFSFSNGKSDNGPPSTDLNVWMYATSRGGAAAAVAALLVSRVWSIEYGRAHAVDVRASSADNSTLKEGIVYCPLGELVLLILDRSVLAIDNNDDMQ